MAAYITDLHLDDRTWLISDTQFFHKKIGQYCSRPDGWQDLIIKNLNYWIHPDDIVFHLGDLALGKKETSSTRGVGYISWRMMVQFMRIFNNSREVIEKNQEAIVIFTHGPLFTYDSLGNGTTGNWVVDPETLDEVDKVIIYLRRENESVNRIFLGNYAGIRKSDIPGRHIIRFSALKEVGITESNWPDFANSGQNPVSYVIA